jgi:hypothetical protein
MKANQRTVFRAFRINWQHNPTCVHAQTNMICQATFLQNPPVNGYLCFSSSNRFFGFPHLFDLPGNHDEFDLFSSGSDCQLDKSYSLMNYSNDQDDFSHSHNRKPGLCISLMNSFYFPRAYPVIDFVAHPKLKCPMIEADDREFEKHLPSKMWLIFGFLAFSKRFESLTNSTNADLMICAHLHPSMAGFLPLWKSVEICGSWQDLALVSRTNNG